VVQQLPFSVSVPFPIDEFGDLQEMASGQAKTVGAQLRWDYGGRKATFKFSDREIAGVFAATIRLRFSAIPVERNFEV
jgi:hypothetical protein